ncbi:MAG: hypothetical protein U9N77_17025, partial [Thermodesulfobacteriota bacterium]|nr:hypothetical protein [Thermodesulfobacteriota bacterium]
MLRDLPKNNPRILLVFLPVSCVAPMGHISICPPLPHLEDEQPDHTNWPAQYTYIIFFQIPYESLIIFCLNLYFITFPLGVWGSSSTK